jgi:hypothetical protein
MNNRFNFVGNISIPKETSKKPLLSTKTIEYVRNGKKNSMELTSLNFGIKESDTNMAFMEVSDSPRSIIKSKDTDNNDIEIDWDDRKDPDIVATVANYRKYIVNLGEEFDGRQEFLTQFDMIEFLAEKLPEYKGKILAVGDYQKTYSKGKWYEKFRLQNLYAVEEDRKSRLGLTFDFYYNKDSIDKTDFKDEKKIYLDGYIKQYINKDEGSKYIPMQLVFNASKYDMENEKHKQLFDYKMLYMDIKNKNMCHLAWEVVLLRGAEAVDFTYDMLTPAQKMQVDLGVRELDDFKPKNGVLGDKVNEYRVFEPVLKDFGKGDDFSDGLVELDMKMSEFEDEIYVPNAVEEKLDETEDEPKKSAKKVDDDVPEADGQDDEAFDLF